MKMFFTVLAWSIFITSVALVFVVNIYCWLNPIDHAVIDKIRDLRPLNLSDARNYYTIVYYGWTSFLAFSGLILGLYYYFHKKSTDASNSRFERRRKRLEALISELNKIDDGVNQILLDNVKTDEELQKLRIQINRIWENFEILLGLSEQLLGLDRNESFEIIKAYSFVEKSDILMRTNLVELKKVDRGPIKSEFTDVIQSARRICYLKMEE